MSETVGGEGEALLSFDYRLREGLATSRAYELGVRILRDMLHDFVLVGEAEMVRATRLFIRHTRSLVELAGGEDALTTVDWTPYLETDWRAEADTTHWLTHGYSSGMPALLARNEPLPLSQEGANPVTYATDRLRVSGFVWPELGRRTYAGQAYATVDPSGDGVVIRLAEDPVFRVFADGPLHLLMNAIYLGARGSRTASGY